MSHETTVYGYIEGAYFRGEDFRKYQLINLEILHDLPDEDEFPFLSRSMFSSPPLDQRRGTFRSQIIHFGGTMNGLDFDVVPAWINKFEDLLRLMYWREAVVHILTDYIDGEYRFHWSIHSEIFDSYQDDFLVPTTKWIRDETHGERQLLSYE